MDTHDLSILIPSRSEMFLSRTIEDIIANIEADTEIITVLDGEVSDPPIPHNARVNVIKLAKSIGQRAATNLACKLSRAKYVMKVDAHCSFERGFDRKMIEAFKVTGDNVTMVPIMRNLWAFDWKCYHCGWKKYQGPTPLKCEQCGKGDKLRRKMLWIGKHNPQSTSYCFDATPHFQYFEDWKHRNPYMKDKEEKGLTETMSLQGSCWMLTREKYWELNICDEAFGGWGSQGIEVAVKTWLSGGAVIVNHKTWYAHMFRTQGGDFGFPYPISHRQQEGAKAYARDLFFNNKWEKQIHPFSWLIEKFWPVKGWTEEDLARLKANTFEFSAQGLSTKTPESEPTEEKPTENQPIAVKPSKGIVYYTDNELGEKIAWSVREQLLRISEALEIPIVSASLRQMDFGVKNIPFPSHERGVLTMFRQILAALEASTAENVFFCEHNVLYHPSHFEFTPPTKDKFYYNENVWSINPETGHALHKDRKLVSGMCVNRELALAHYRKRVETVEKNGWNPKMGLEPGMHRRKERVDDLTSGSWKSEFPNIEIQNGESLSPTKKFAKGWEESDINNIPGWENLRDLI